MKIKNIQYSNFIVALLGISLMICITITSLSNEMPQNFLDGSGEVEVFIITPDNVADIKKVITTADGIYRIILLKEGEYVLEEAIHIAVSKIAIIGEEGVVLRLADRVNQPVILVGDDKEVPEYIIEEIKIENIEIDGNMDNQTSETGDPQSWIRNNGIDIRKVRNLSISNVLIHHCRSGGVVASWDSENIFIYNSYFYSNYFDGIALYASKNVLIKDFVSSRNNAAGISIDNKLQNAVFINGLLLENLDVGIFARDSSDISFLNVMVVSNASYGCFLSHQHPKTATGCSKFTFNGCSFIGNKKTGMWLAAPIEDSYENKLLNCIFAGNEGKQIELSPGASLLIEGCKIAE